MCIVDEIEEASCRPLVAHAAQPKVMSTRPTARTYEEDRGMTKDVDETEALAAEPHPR